ncbi:MAG: TetR/AcrR family transcriptional regulator [Deltaproteobacteria bacterium]|nr:MAG: TetR/AcrR family transcriptional regulator [Deltaproteobacteria bacterium]
MSSRLTVDARRAQLLELGLRLFSTRAYDDVSIDEIAREAGISKGLLYHYFGGKKAFYVAVVALAAGHLLQAVAPSVNLPRPERARIGLAAYFDFVEARAPAFSALMRGGLGVDPEVGGIVDRTRRAIVAMILDGAGLAEPRPAFRVAARAWVGAVEAASLDWLEHRDVPREELISLLVAGLGGMLAQAAMLDPEAGASLDLSALAGLWSGKALTP